MSSKSARKRKKYKRKMRAERSRQFRRATLISELREVVSEVAADCLKGKAVLSNILSPGSTAALYYATVDGVNSFWYRGGSSDTGLRPWESLSLSELKSVDLDIHDHGLKPCVPKSALHKLAEVAEVDPE